MDFKMRLDSLVVTVVSLIRGTISNNWRLRWPDTIYLREGQLF